MCYVDCVKYSIQWINVLWLKLLIINICVVWWFEICVAKILGHHGDRVWSRGVSLFPWLTDDLSAGVTN